MKIVAGRKYLFKATSWDVFDKMEMTPEDGTIVKVIKAPYGCPKNGTMGHCYIGDEDGNFIGLVCCSSLLPI
jgi:hypothetical protein